MSFDRMSYAQHVCRCCTTLDAVRLNTPVLHCTTLPRLQLCSSIRTAPKVDPSAAMLENTKKEIEKLKASIHKNFQKNADHRENAIKAEQNSRQSALQRRLAQRAKVCDNILLATGLPPVRALFWCGV